MSPQDAAKLLEVGPDATPEQSEARFLELRTRLEDKIAKAPTPGLKEKYRVSLAQITEAFETLTLAADSSSLPVLRRESLPPTGGPRPERASNPPLPAAEPPVAAPAAVYRPDFLTRCFVLFRSCWIGLFVAILLGLLSGFVLQVVLNGDYPDELGVVVGIVDIVLGLWAISGWYRRIIRLKAERFAKEQAELAGLSGAEVRRREAEAKRASEFRLVLVGSVGLLVVGGIWVAYSQLEKSQAEAQLRNQARDAAESRQFAEEEKQRAAEDEKSDRDREERQLTQLRARMAELGVLYEAAMRNEQTADRELSDLRAQERDAARETKAGPNPVLDALRAQVAAQNTFVTWIRDELPTHPARINKAKATELISARAVREAEEAVQAFANALDDLQEDLTDRRPDLPAVAEIDRLRKSAIAGDVGAMNNLGVAYIRAKGSTHDAAAAESWYRRSAEKGNEVAMYNLGNNLLVERAGRPKDEAAALSWLRQAADKNYPSALDALGDAYANGSGVPKDEAMAIEWWRRAAKLGNKDSQATLTKRGLTW